MVVEVPQQHGSVSVLEVVGRLFDFVLVEHVAVRDAAQRPVRPHDVENAFDALQVHGEALESVGDFAGDRLAVETAHLLEVGELRDFHAVQPHLPTESPGAERGRLPVVLDEADVVHQRVEAERAQRAQIQIEDGQRRWLDDHLELVVVLQAKRVVAVAPVGGTARRLHVCRGPGLGTDGSEERRGVETCRRPSPCRTAAGSRSLARPSISAARKSGPEMRACSGGGVEGIGQVRVLAGAQYSGAPPKTTANSATVPGRYRLTTRISYTSEMALPSHA